jgi:AraC-like DNA-binding protein
LSNRPKGVELDPISDIFRTFQIDALVQSRLEATAPWALSMDAQPGDQKSGGFFAQRPGVAYFGFLSRGTCWLELPEEKELLTLGEGDCFLLAPDTSFRLSDQPHGRPISFCSLRGKSIDNVVRYGGGGPPTTLIWGLLQLRQGGLQPLRALLPRSIVLQQEQARSGGVGALVQLLAEEMAGPQPGSEVAANRLAEVLFIQILRSFVKASSHSKKTGWLSAIFDPSIGAALRAIHADIKRAWTVEALAQLAGMSRSSFAERFKLLLRETPMQYVASWKMQKSLTLLADGGTKLSEIARQVGYETDAAYSKAFRRVVGMTPGKYRAQKLTVDDEGSI